jgi:hypothetical protein
MFAILSLCISAVSIGTYFLKLLFTAASSLPAWRPASNYTFALMCNLKRGVITTFAYNLSIYGSTALVGLGPFFSFLIYTQSVGLLGRRISPSQGRYLRTDWHKQRINAHRHPWLEWNSNPRSQFSSGEDDSCLRPRGQCDRLSRTSSNIRANSFTLDLLKCYISSEILIQCSSALQA